MTSTELVLYNEKGTSNYPPKKILLISNMNIGPAKNNILSRKEMLFDILNNSKINCDIKVVSVNAINHLNELLLIYYDCVIYDLLDTGCNIINPSGELENYVKNGGNIIVTHDHVYFRLDRVLGLQYTNRKELRVYKKAINVSPNHEIWKSYYSLNNWEKLVMNVDTHSEHIISNNDTTQLMLSNDNNNDLYLSVRSLGRGKAVFWNVGHNPNLTEDEKKIYLNIMAWVLNVKIN